MVIETIQANPRVSIILIALGVSLFISLINYFVLDKEKLKKSKGKQKELNKQIKENKNNPTKMMELQKELMSHTMEQMKHSFKPMLITLVPVLIAFWWIKSIFVETTLAGSWLWWYIGAALVFSLVFRKVFKLP